MVKLTERLVALATQHTIPAIYPLREFVGLTPGTKLTNIAINRVLSLFLKKTPLFFIKIPPFPRTKGVRTQAIISNSSFQMKRWRVPATSERGRKSEKRTWVEFNCPARRLCPTDRLGKWQPPRRAADRARRRSERHASCGLGRTCRPVDGEQLRESRAGTIDPAL
jgi:hypothetical protein